MGSIETGGGPGGNEVGGSEEGAPLPGRDELAGGTVRLDGSLAESGIDPDMVIDGDTRGVCRL